MCLFAGFSGAGFGAGTVAGSRWLRCAGWWGGAPEHGAGGSGGTAEGDLISREAMVIRQEAIVPGQEATVLRCEAVVPGHEATVIRPEAVVLRSEAIDLGHEATIFRWEAVVLGCEAVVGRYGVESFPGNYFPFYSGIFVPVLVGALEGGRVWKKRNTTEKAGG